MRLILRIAGTWLIGLAVVLLVVDGTRSLAANALVFASLADLWTQLHPPSLQAVRDFFSSRFFAQLLDAALTALLTYPAFAVFGVPGVILALLGRKPRRERYLRADQI
jgi:predicted PurR-regulated permease PerM